MTTDPLTLDLFRQLRIEQIILKHPLLRLASIIAWSVVGSICWALRNDYGNFGAAAEAGGGLVLC
jgi:hypothetical protein